MLKFSQADDAKTTEQEFKNAGFRVEKVGNTTVFERDVPDSVVEATRVLIRSNVKGAAVANGSRNGNGNGKGNGKGNGTAK